LRNIIIDDDSVKLIDYGSSLEYLDHDGKHFSNSSQNKFKGNTIIASSNVMKFGRPSRKDDLISLIYLVLSLTREFEVVKEDVSHMGQIEYFNYVLSLKEELTIDDYCHSPGSRILKPFISEVWALKYEEKPDY
jgi:serine/threonine protein kinase